MKYEINFSCGHTATVDLGGPTKERERKIEYFKNCGLCPSCYKEYQRVENEKIEAKKDRAVSLWLEKAGGEELPELVGSERQIKWAKSIRADFIDHAFKSSFGNLRQAGIGYLLLNMMNASEWIDSRKEVFNELIDKYTEKYMVSLQDEAIGEKNKETIDEAGAKAEATVVPEAQRHDGIAEIRVIGDTIKVFYQKDDEFIKLVKSLHYRWKNRCWQRDVDTVTDAVADRAAELGSALLLSGFPICIMDPEIRRKAIEADYKEEVRNWVKLIVSGPYKGWLRLNWEGWNDGLSTKARTLPGVKWLEHRPIIPIENYMALEDFAECNGFGFSDGAKEAIAKYAQVDILPQVPSRKEPKEDELRKILNSSREVLDDLKD